jgi:hypothetical protein
MKAPAEPGACVPPVYHVVSALAEVVGRWAAGRPEVRAAFWFGGYVRARLWPESDLDSALLLHGPVNGDALSDSLARALEDAGHPVSHVCVLTSEGRITLWAGSAPTRVDVILAARPAELEWLADARDVPAPRLVAAWRVDDVEVEALLARAALEYDPLDAALRRNLAETETDKFVVAFEACSAAHAKSDAYAFYFHYNLALGRLARIIQLVRGGAEHLYLPRQLTSSLMPLEEQTRFWALAGTLYLPEALERKRALADWFVAAVREACGALGVRRDADGLAHFLERLQLRDFFFNVRDFATYYRGVVVPGRLFRASSLARWGTRPELDTWLAQNGVSDIVDLRTGPEVAEMPYPSHLRDRVRIHTVSMEPVGDGAGSAVRTTDVPTWTAFRGIAEVIAEASGAVVVHCHIGRDRTGWIFTVLAAALGLPEQCIVADYVGSRMRTEAATAEALLEALRKQGGARTLADNAGIPAALLERLANRLLLAVPATGGDSL